MNRVAAVFDDGIAIVVVEIKFARHGLKRLANNLFGDVNDVRFRIHLRASRGEKFARFVVVDLDARMRSMMSSVRRISLGCMGTSKIINREAR